MYFCSGCQTTSSNFRRNTSVSILTNRSRTTGMNLWSMGQQTACESFCSGAGFKRDSTEYIRKNANTYVRGTPDNPKLLKTALLECPNELVRRDTEEIQYNVPELFIDEGEE